MLIGGVPQFLVAATEKLPAPESFERSHATAKAEFANLLSSYTKPPRPESNQAGEDRSRSIRQFYIKKVTASLAFFDKYPTDPLRWDALLLAVQGRNGYSEHARLWSSEDKDGEPYVLVDRAEALEAIRRLVTTDEFSGSSAWRRTETLSALALEASDIDPVVFAAIASQKIFGLRAAIYPAYLDFIRSGIPREMAEVPFREVRRLTDEIERRFPKGVSSNTVTSYGLWSVDTSYRRAIEFKLRMIRRLRGELDYRKELRRVSQLNFPDAASYAQRRLKIDAQDIGGGFELACSTMSGQTFDVANLGGKAALIVFWATWHKQSLADVPMLRRLFAKYHAQGLEMLGVSFDTGEEKKFSAFCEENQISWPQNFDGKGWKSDIGLMYGITELPSTFVVDRSGILIALNSSEGELEQNVRKALGLPPYEGAIGILSKSSEWKYNDSGSAPPVAWNNETESSVAWKSGFAPFGYDVDDSDKRFGTLLSFGDNLRAKHIAYYFVKEFNVAAAQAGQPFGLLLTCDDGAVIYINGREIGRVNMADGVIGNETLAVKSGSITGKELVGSAGVLREGRNVIAVSVHQANGASSDVAFDLSLFVMPVRGN